MLDLLEIDGAFKFRGDVDPVQIDPQTKLLEARMNECVIKIQRMYRKRQQMK